MNYFRNGSGIPPLVWDRSCTVLTVRLTVLAFALLNQLLVASGYQVLPVEEAELEQALTTIITLVAALWNMKKSMNLK